ncbi:MAG TPA: hypothetical protein DDZ51_23505 [Planctomycetaceae bacterium]|nr:hypothetical protein [Planctomycetaceae bacterium]
MSINSSDVFAQGAAPAIPIGGPVPEFSLSDIPLAEGERIVTSDTGPGGAVIQFDGSAYKTVDPSAVPTAASGMSHQSPMMSSGFASGSCATGNCGSSSCRSGSCGTPGCRNKLNGPGVDLGGNPRLGGGGNACGPTCNPYTYAAVDALYMKHNDLNSFGSPAPFNLRDFDYELGVRVTIGMVPDCHNGYEVSFLGPFQWGSSNQMESPLNDIDAALVAGLPIAAAGLSTFFDADFAAQNLDAELMSFELNRTMIGWDVIKLLYGMRYIQYDEDFLYTSRRTLVGPPGAPGIGILASRAENRMIGGQVGIDMTYPITCRMWSDMRARAGAFANFAENRFQLTNNDALQIFNEADTTELAGMIEFGGGLRYYLTNNFHIRGGGELMYVTEVATALNQFGSVMTPGTGRAIDASDSFFLYGFSVGAELKF